MTKLFTNRPNSWEKKSFFNGYTEVSACFSEWQSVELSDSGGDSDVHSSAGFETALDWDHTQEGEV